MRVNTVKAAVIVMVLLAGWASYALANTAVTVNPSAITWTAIDQEISIGYRFYIDKTITVTHLGLFDSVNGQLPGAHNGPGLVGTHTVAIWRLPKTGGFDLKRQVTIGPGAQLSDNHAWVALDEPLTITPDPVPLNGFYERWMVGVWTPNYLVPGVLGDALIFSPQSAVTFDIVNADIMRFDGYTLKDPAYTFAPPWPASGYSYAYGVNFRYSVPGPTANAGPDAEIYTSEQALTTIAGTAIHTVPGTPMQYQWFEGETALSGLASVGADGAAPLNLGPVPALSIGVHTLKLHVTDGTYTSDDTMQLTVANSPPYAQPAPTYQVLEIGADAILLTAEVADFDGDAVNYQWVKDGAVLDSGTITPPKGGAPVEIPDLAIPAGDPRFTLGSNQVQFVVSDGVNPAVTVTATVMLQDTTAPTIAPTSSLNMLWPPNGKLVPITIWANDADNGGGGIVLTASVQCSENDGLAEPDSIIDSIDNTAGTIALSLRAERAGSGDGRIYTVTITATDSSANQSVATVDIRVPHDKRKK
jgi:hypothetical protein